MLNKFLAEKFAIGVSEVITQGVLKHYITIFMPPTFLFSGFAHLYHFKSTIHDTAGLLAV